jgi:ribosome-associated protein
LKKLPPTPLPARVPNPAARELLKKCCAALLEKKAENLLAFYVGAQSSVTDYLVVATGSSDPHRRALRIELERVFKDNQARIVGVESSDDSGWTVVDAFDVMVHLFSPEQRDRYRLEKLWRDADQINVTKLVDGEPVPASTSIFAPQPKKAPVKRAKPAPAKKPAKAKKAAKPAKPAKAAKTTKPRQKRA